LELQGKNLRKFGKKRLDQNQKKEKRLKWSFEKGGTIELAKKTKGKRLEREKQKKKTD